MDEFIQSAVSQLGIDESTAKNATGKALGFLKDNLGDQFSEISQKIPGADQLIEQAPADDDGGGGGGMIGGLGNVASNLMGGDAGEGMQLLSSLQNTGMSAEKSGSFITMLIDFIKQKVGDAVIGQITSKIPMLKSLTG